MDILIVDDIETNRKLLRVILQAEGHHTIEAGDGLEALEILGNQSVDAIVSDILMPRMDGYRLCHAVRNRKETRNVLFIFYTSTFTTTPDEKVALEFGADRFIRKPAPIKEILDALAPADRQGRSRPSPAESVAELTALQGYSEVLVRKLEHRNSELQLTRDQLLRTNAELVSRTEELQAAKARHERTANQLQSLFDNLEDVFFSVDMKQRRLIQISSSCEKVYGLSQREFFSNPMLWREVSLPADRMMIDEGEADLNAGRLWQGEFRIQKPDADTCWVQAKIKPVLDEAGALTRIDGVVSDISARRQLEGQLLHSQKLEGVGRLAGGVAHDFNNLLTVILGYSDLALAGLDADNPRRLQIEEIQRAGERARGLTRQLLAFSRKQILDPHILDLNSVIANAEGWLKRLIGEDIQLSTDLASELKPVRADSGQIEQVILNLAVNARDAMPSGGRLTIVTANVEVGEIQAQNHATVRPGPYVMVAVSDTGCGMTEEIQSHLFEPFFTTKDPGKGTGLGLATVYGIVKQSDGHIWVYSEPGVGTTFKIYLPPAEHRAEIPISIATPTEDRGQGETVLVVEDDEAVRTLIVTVLQNKGYNVLEARDGEHALVVETEGAARINLLLTDTIMPGIGGPALWARLKVADPAMRVLFMSGYTEDAMVLHELLDSGAAFLQKPFGPETLARKVREVLNPGERDG